MTVRIGPDPSSWGAAVRIYRALLGALPAHLKVDRDEMAGALADQLDDARGWWSSVGILGRAFGRLPTAVVLAWLDELRVVRNTSGNGGGSGMGDFVMNVRFATRTLIKSPTFTWAAVLLIALGVGAVTTV